MYEVIPFKTFIAGASIAPAHSITAMVDGGLTFFLGTGAVLLGLVVLEKMGFEINESMIRYFVWCGALIAVLYAVLKNPLFRRLLVGF